MTTPKASGPLLARCTDNGRPRVSTVISDAYADGKQRLTHHQYRLIPGHGKVVPVENVNAILAAYLSVGTGERWQTNLKDAIDKALEGAI
jgi:hypothetical protein